MTVNGTGHTRGWKRWLNKDLTAALLARQLDADVLLLLTDVAAVQDGYGTAAGAPDPPGHARRAPDGNFPAGSMDPKIEAVCRFVEATGKLAAIGRLSDAQALFARQRHPLAPAQAAARPGRCV